MVCPAKPAVICILAVLLFAPVSNAQDTHLDGEFIRWIPVYRDYQSVYSLMTSLGSLAILPGHHMLIDGFEISNPVTAISAANVNLEAVKEVRLHKAGLDARYGHTSGSILEIVTNRGADTLHLDTVMYARPEVFGTQQFGGSEDPLEEDYFQVHINGSGPIIPKQLWLFTSFQLGRRFFNENQDVLRFTHLTKLTWRINEKHDLVVLAHGHPATQTNLLQVSYYAPEAERQSYEDGSVYGLLWNSRWTENLHCATRLSLGFHRRHEFPQSGCTSTTDERCRSIHDAVTGVVSGNDTQEQDWRAYRIGLDSRVNWLLHDLLGEHSIIAGLQYSPTIYTEGYSIPGGGYYVTRAGRPWRLTLVDPDWRGEISGREDTVALHSLGLHLQDNWRILETLTLSLGLRLDLAWFTDRHGNEIGDVHSFSPRISLAWQPFGDDMTSIRIGYSRYHTNPGFWNLDFATYIPFSTTTWEYDPATGKYDILIRREGGGYSDHPPVDTINPYTDEVHLHVHQRLPMNFWAQVSAIYRHINDDSYSYSPFPMPPRDPHPYIYLPLDILGIEVSAGWRSGEKYQFLATYAYVRTSDDLDDVLTSAANEQHTLNLLGHVRLSDWFHVGTRFRYSKIDPFTLYWPDLEYRFFLVGNVPPTPWQESPENVRLDLRLAWVASRGAQTAEVFVDIFTLFHIGPYGGLPRFGTAREPAWALEPIYLYPEVAVWVTGGLRFRY